MHPVLAERRDNDSVISECLTSTGVKHFLYIRSVKFREKNRSFRMEHLKKENDYDTMI